MIEVVLDAVADISLPPNDRIAEHGLIGALRIGAGGDIWGERVCVPFAPGLVSVPLYEPAKRIVPLCHGYAVYAGILPVGICYIVAKGRVSPGLGNAGIHYVLICDICAQARFFPLLSQLNEAPIPFDGILYACAFIHKRLCLLPYAS